MQLPSITPRKFRIVLRVLILFASALVIYTLLAPFPDWLDSHHPTGWKAFALRVWAIPILLFGGRILVKVTMLAMRKGWAAFTQYPASDPLEYPPKPGMSNEEFWRWVESDAGRKECKAYRERRRRTTAADGGYMG